MSNESGTPISQSRQAVGAHLRRLRQLASLSLQDVASRISALGIPVSHSTISRIELGQNAVSADLLLALTETLGASFGELEEIMRLARARTRIDFGGLDAATLMRQASDLARQGDYAAALDCYEAARDEVLQSEEGTDRVADLAELMLYAAEAHRRLRQYTMSTRLAGRVLNMPGCPDALTFRALLIHIQVGYLAGEFYQARVFARQAAEMLDDMEPRWRSLGCGVLAVLEYKQERWSEAIRRFQDAILLYTELDVEIEVARMSVSLGYARHKIGDTTLGTKTIENALDRARRIEAHDVAAYALRSLGRIAVDDGNRLLAEKHLEEAASIAADIGLPHEEFIALFVYWRACDELGERRSAKKQETRLAKLIRGLDRRLPEVQEYLRRTTDRSSPPRNTP